ncbi:MAG: prepilin-type N-terminal cleavage/methylation domain-containing protein [Candidatus Riflebacteria bacterium]|nr:prepilin-type N-terminal cleavage/methylation domain-containing protein [Candidatus Riflebacteria bacterium]
MKPKKGAFTLIELMMACLVLAIFVYYAYELFIGGSKTANKAQWINGITTQLRNTINLVNNQLKSTSYPTTLLDDAIYDPIGSSDPSKPYEKFFVKILPDQITGGDYGIQASSLTSQKKLMTWVMCEAESVKIGQNKFGILTRSYLVFIPTTSQPIKVGKLVLRSKTFSFSTNPTQKYAQSGNFSSLSLDASKEREVPLCEDVEEVRITVTNLPPAKDPEPIKVSIKCRWPKDTKVAKENSMNFSPNVGVGLLGAEALPGD